MAEFALGSLVELLGLPESLEASELLGTTDGSVPESYRPNGKRGKVVAFSEGEYTVETFDAVLLSAPAASLKAFVPSTPEDGGFHIAWPDGSAEAEAEFAADAVERLLADGYCVVQMSMSEQIQQKALAEAEAMKYKRMRQEFEVAYLGRQHKCKAAWLDQLAENKRDTSLGLDQCDLKLSNFTKFLLPLAPCALNFIPYSRTNGMVRMPFQSSAEEGASQSVELNDEDIEDGLVDSHIQFLKRRQVCMLYVVATGGGELTLIHKDQAKDNVPISLTQGRLVVFLTSRMTYMYNAFSKSDLVLQSWVLQEPDSLKLVGLQGDQASKDEAWGLTVGPSTPADGPTTNVFGLGVGLPGGMHGTDLAYFNACALGTDAQVFTPACRFDMDVYSTTADEWHPGTTYAVHGGYVAENIYALDADRFGISEDEAYIMGPAHKQLLEKGYEAMYRSGYKQGPDLRGRKCGIFLGHSGDDWSGTQVFTLGFEDKFRMGHSSRIWACIAGRIAYVLGLKGPQVLTDTACSSALVAYGVGHTMLRGCLSEQNRSGVDNALSEAIMCGGNMMPGPGNYINLSGPHMLSARGRCFTFDHSADGFARGEGTGAFYVKREEIMSPDSFATVIGACLNEDGRSASMTAPNGPAQQECIRGSMKEAGRTANEVTCAECHGTGTALGDPIEVGALRGVMQDRIVPIIQTSAKTHIGHLEASAGTAGIIKCMMMCRGCVGTPNCHFTELNPHLDIAGYPTIFADNLTDYGYNSGFSGVSSFGFGGANSRADVYAAAKVGPHATMRALNWEKVDYITVKCPIDEGPMHYVDGKCIPRATSKDYMHDAYHADCIRDEFNAYDYNSSLYEGEYQLAPREVLGDDMPKDPIYIVGSWDQFHESHEMEAGEEEGVWTFRLMIGDGRHERFQLRVDDDAYRALYPCSKNGNERTRCLGPDDMGGGHYWLVDGRDARVPAGTVYQITFTWGSPPKMRWEVVDHPAPVWCRRLMHGYSIDGSWTGGIFDGMKDVSTADTPSTFEARIRIGMTGMEWFRFARDNDPLQLIYPAKEQLCSEDIAVCGPDDMCGGRSWRVKGKSGEVVIVRLQVIDAHVTVTVLSPSMGTLKMQSVEGPKRHTYYVSGSFNDWGYDKMEYDENTLSTFRYTGTVGYACQEMFFITAEREASQAFFPEAEGAYPGDAIVVGPEPATEAGAFYIYSLKAGAQFEISFDRNSIDKRKIVDIKWTDRVDSDSMKLAYYNFAVTRGGAALGDVSAAVPALA